MDLSLRATVATECQPDLFASKPSQARGGEFGIINNRWIVKEFVGGGGVAPLICWLLCNYVTELFYPDRCPRALRLRNCPPPSATSPLADGAVAVYAEKEQSRRYRLGHNELRERTPLNVAEADEEGGSYNCSYYCFCCCFHNFSFLRVHNRVTVTASFDTCTLMLRSFEEAHL